MAAEVFFAELLISPATTSPTMFSKFARPQQCGQCVSNPIFD
jgi:hypothetical protein